MSGTVVGDAVRPVSSPDGLYVRTVPGAIVAPPSCALSKLHTACLCLLVRSGVNNLSSRLGLWRDWERTGRDLLFLL